MRTYNLVEVGREKYSGTVRALEDNQLLKKVKEHLKSKDVEITWNGAIGTVWAGFRNVGYVTKEGGIS